MPDPNDGLFNAAKEHEQQELDRDLQALEEQARRQQTANDAGAPGFNPSAGLFSASAERALGGIAQTRQTDDSFQAPAVPTVEKSPKRRRPLIVTLIGAYKILTSLVVLLSIGLLYFMPQSILSGAALDHILLLRSKSGTPLIGIPVIYAVYGLIVGIGLLARWKWARRAVMGGAFAALVYGCRYLYITSIFFGSLKFPGAEELMLGMIFQLIIFLTLKLYPGVREAYGVGDLEK